MQEPTLLNHEELIIKLLQENQTLLVENNELLNKLERRAKRAVIFKIIWYAILLGVPLLAYYYLYNTFLSAFSMPGDGAMGVDTAALQQLMEVYLGQ